MFDTMAKCVILVIETNNNKTLTVMKSFKVTYKNQTGFHTEKKDIQVFATNKEQAKKTAWIRLNREGKNPLRISDNWAEANQIK